MMKLKKRISTLAFLWAIYTPQAMALELSTNEVIFTNVLPWLTTGRVNRVVNQIQQYMEWDIRKVKVNWYSNQALFEKFHGYDSSVLAVSSKIDNTISLGPRVNSINFDPLFGHELVHIILFQKYKEAIPLWLEEGLANFIAKNGKVDYAWLASQPEQDVQLLVHPFLSNLNTKTPYLVSAQHHYQASTALVEMIDSKCNLRDLLQLSVGEKLKQYLSTFCGLSDINTEFQKWIGKKLVNSKEIVPKH